MNIIDESFPDDSLIDHINLEYKEYVPIQRTIAADNPFAAIDEKHQSKVATGSSNSDSLGTTATIESTSSQQQHHHQRFAKSGAALRSNTFRRHQSLKKKSHSVDSLHYSGETTLKPNPSYQHVESKVKIYIDQLQEQDRLNVKFKRHSSMPETLSRSPQELESVAGSSRSSCSGGSNGSSVNNNSDLVAIQLELEEKIKLLEYNDEVISNFKKFYESADRNFTEECQKNLKLQNKIDAMRLELLRITEEYQSYKMQQQRQQQQHQPSYKLFNKFQKSNSLPSSDDKQDADTSEIMFSNSSIGSSVGSMLSAVLTTKTKNDALNEKSFLLRKRTKSSGAGGGAQSVSGKYTQHIDSSCNSSDDEEELLGRHRHKVNNNMAQLAVISPPPITSTASKTTAILGAPKKSKKYKKRKRSSRILKLFSFCCLGAVRGNGNQQNLAMHHFDNKIAFNHDSAYNSNLNSFT